MPPQLLHIVAEHHPKATPTVTYLVKSLPKQALAADAAGNTPVHLAATAAHDPAVLATLQALAAAAPAALLAENGDGETPLHRAAGGGQRDLAFYKPYIYSCAY